jgi:ATP-dependent helicase IRC3
VLLRSYQDATLDKSLERYRSGVNRQLAVLATGLGKAVLFAALRHHHGFRKRVMVLIHREELAVQAADKIFRWNPGLMVGVEMADRKARAMDDYVVASVPTLGRAHSARLAKFSPEDFDCIVSDEAHHSTSPQWKRVLGHFNLLAPNESPILSLGLTATPNRSDGAGLRDCFDEIIYDMGIDSGIGQGYLADLSCWRIGTKTSLDGVHTRSGDFAQDELGKTVNTPTRNGLVVQAWAHRALGKKTIVFSVDVQHALDLAEAFKAYGVAAEAIWGEDPDRKDKLARHRRGELEVLCNCGILTEGYDDAGIECIVLARPTKSLLLLTQMVGRGTRLPVGREHISDVMEGEKDHCVVLDMADVTNHHNLATVPSLLGLPQNLDMKGETYRKAKEKIDRIANAFPTANLAELRDLGKLDHIAEQVKLFDVKFPPEIKLLTELAWRKQGDGYYLPVKRDRLALAQDLRNEWWVRGTIEGRQIEIHSQNLAGAFNAADREVMADTGNKRLLERDARWRGNAPSDGQVELCKRIGLDIPTGATRGQVSAAIDAKLSSRRQS